VIKRHRLINTFKQLVRLDSLSLHEAEIIRYLKKQLKGLALNNYEAGRPKEGEVGSLIVEVPASGVKEPRLLLNAHLDTVSPGENVRPLQKDGYLTSDGKTILGADDKAGVAVILEILRVLKEKKLPHPPLLVILTVAEEIGLVGARALPENLLDNRAPSQCNLTVKVFGKAAHAGIHPEEGINAIKVASEAISKMKLGRIDAETTANIGLIKGGRATNIIPE
jgi:tripeptide aminopeptidase